MSICDGCIHDYVCGLEDNHEEGIVSCADRIPKDVLDKIRAEIEHIGGDDEKTFCKNLNESYKQGLKDALKVIDKYKAESEVSYD